ncbi:alpha/beta fold hydrolase [Tsuneonella mangrovi]|uniref:alpha/beta fold hydrolase n=1 Tax=Tsuneonella mangrovi TaxID=1982042 RepID=UPI000BA22406|nr:alpha/beta fold hydrolase [Tsuneonella mangrovi]
MTNVRTESYPGFGGDEMALHRLGAGRSVLLLHGLFSSAETNWIRFGHAQLLADAGFEAIMPDLRAHGQSAAPHDPAAYPPDVLALDLAALVAHLDLGDFDLVGFSLGSRTSVRGVVSGLRPRRLVLGGMGLEGVTGWLRRRQYFEDVIARFGTIKPGDPAYFAQQFLKTSGTDREAVGLLIASIADTDPADLAVIAMPTLVVCGTEDRDNGDPRRLVEALPDATLAEVPGTHMGSVTHADLGQAIADFLTG